HSQALDASAHMPGWHVFAGPLAIQAHRRLDDGSSFRHHGHGLLLGAEHTRAGAAWTLGVHAAFIDQRLHMDNPLASEARSELWQLGMHGRYVPDNRRGPYLLAQVSAGAARTRLERTMETSEWRGTTHAR